MKFFLKFWKNSRCWEKFNILEIIQDFGKKFKILEIVPDFEQNLTFCTIVRRHSSKFQLNCALLVTILKLGTQRETIGKNIFSYRTTLTNMLFPWKLHLNELHVKSHFLHILQEIWTCRRIEIASRWPFRDEEWD